MEQRNSERSEKAKGLGTARLGEKARKLGHASGGFKPWAWTNGECRPTDFDDSAESWREEAGRAWVAESPAGQAWLVVGAAACAMLTVGWVGWVVWMVCSKG